MDSSKTRCAHFSIGKPEEGGASAALDRVGDAKRMRVKPTPNPRHCDSIEGRRQSVATENILGIHCVQYYYSSA